MKHPKNVSSNVCNYTESIQKRANLLYWPYNCVSIEMAAPPFVPLDASLSRFGGFLRVGKDEFKVQLHGVDSTGQRINFANAELLAETPLAELLAPHREALKASRTLVHAWTLVHWTDLVESRSG